MYIDGLPVTSTTPGSPASVAFDTTIQSIAIGAVAKSAFGDAWRGDIDDVRLYNEALGDADIALLATVPEPNGIIMIVIGLSVLGMVKKNAKS
jgi:hypothetical protein